MQGLGDYWQKRSPAAKLTTSYVAIIMTISLLFSVFIYHLAVGQIAEGLRHQYLRPRPFSAFIPRPDPAQLEAELDLGRRALQLRLIYFNLVILVLASGASYWLANRTLQPIEEALESQSRFTADASHELRTPLTAMQTEIEVALRNPKLTKEAATSQLRSNLEEVAKLRALSDGLLRLASENGKDFAGQPVELGSVVTAAVQRLAPAAKAKAVKIQSDPITTKVNGDRHSLTDLVAILLDNAVKYSDTGTVVKIETSVQGKFAELRVIDRGHGIKASDLPHIFDRFYRADPSRSKDKVEGYGLGLSIAQKIVDLHQGTIRADSRPGQGSTFVVRLPLASADRA